MVFASPPPPSGFVVVLILSSAQRYSLSLSVRKRRERGGGERMHRSPCAYTYRHMLIALPVDRNDIMSFLLEPPCEMRRNESSRARDTHAQSLFRPILLRVFRDLSIIEFESSTFSSQHIIPFVSHPPFPFPFFSLSLSLSVSLCLASVWLGMRLVARCAPRFFFFFFLCAAVWLSHKMNERAYLENPKAQNQARSWRARACFELGLLRLETKERGRRVFVVLLLLCRYPTRGRTCRHEDTRQRERETYG